MVKNKISHHNKLLDKVFNELALEFDGNKKPSKKTKKLVNAWFGVNKIKILPKVQMNIELFDTGKILSIKDSVITINVF